MPQARLDLPPVEAVSTIEDSYLFVQGPPGSGKTWQGAKMAVALMRDGKRVGVTSLSHKAIHKLLEEIEREAREQGFVFKGRKKSTGGNAESRFEGRFIDSADDWKELLEEDLQLVAGTAWLFAREDFEGFVDTLFVDEAGQVSLADAMAVGSVARNLVFLGDPNQLPQVSQGAQRDEAKVSVLQHLLGEHETVPPERGIFLEHTWRLRPEICAFTSEAYYEGRLLPAEVSARRTLAAGDGLVLDQPEHEGRSQSSWEEADAVAAAIRALLGTTFTDDDVRARRSDRGRLPRRRAVQRAGAPAAPARSGRRSRRDGRQVPGAGGAGRPHLDGELDRRGRAARDRLRVQPPPRERRDLAGAVPRRARVRAAPARRRLQDGRGHAARERGLPLRRAGCRRIGTMTFGALVESYEHTTSFPGRSMRWASSR